MLADWTPASNDFTMRQTARTVLLHVKRARRLLVWITRLAGAAAPWSAAISEATPYGPRT
jgi:hypothetical protein